MSRYFVLYEPSKDGVQFKMDESVSNQLQGEIIYQDMTLLNHRAFTEILSNEDKIVVCGDDRTLNHFVNHAYEITVKNNIYYYAAGGKNEFIYDIGKKPGAVPTYLINRYLKELPVIDLNGVERKFLNGVGFGMDALACEMAEQDEADGKSTNFKVLVRKAVFQYKPGKVVVTVDGKTHSYEKAWFTAIMNGKSLWGNIPVAPGQDRLDKRKRLTVVVIHGIGRLKMLHILHSLFKGKHPTRKSAVEILTGHDITVESETQNLLCLDGELYHDTTKYQVKSPAILSNSKRK